MKNVLIRYQANNYASRCILTGIQKFITDKGDWIPRIVSFPQMLTADMVRSAAKEGYDGILLPVTDDDDVAKALAETPLPISLNVEHYKRISMRKNAIASVGTCNREVGEVGARHFLKLGRFKSYAFAPHPGDPYWSKRRERGFVAELARHGIRAVVFANGGTPEEIADIEKPCAVMGAHDYKAIEIMGYARKAGFDIPGEVAVIGVDADPIVCGFTNPPLTSVEPDFERMGYEASAALDAMMHGHRLRGVNKVLCPPKGIVERASTYFLPTGRLLVDQAKTVIAQEATNGLSVEALSARLRVSPQLLTLRFRQFDRISPYELILKTRLEKVKKLLSNPAMKIDSIAALCGFSSANRLSHLFKERFKVTMRDYRNRQYGSPASPVKTAPNGLAQDTRGEQRASAAPGRRAHGRPAVCDPASR